ncbi:MAG: hypothetical protein LBU92_02215 [Prevotellaceae bacterium]|jgi:hypothetical protein|nr:hypothetical protein [Prevotellaceae bacterium]
MEKQEIIDYFSDISNENSVGVEMLLSTKSQDGVFKRLCSIEDNPISFMQLKQMFVLNGLHGFTSGFFYYYWTAKEVDRHPYDVTNVEGYDNEYKDISNITSLKQLKWGLYRLYIDSLLFFGDVNFGYSHLCKLHNENLHSYFDKKRYEIRERGEALDFEFIEKDDRYLISEMACKTYETNTDSTELLQLLISNYSAAIKQGRKRVSIKELLNGEFAKDDNKIQFEFATEDIKDDEVESESDIRNKYEAIAKKFISARSKALCNTDYYLSLINDLDVYVATSMRNKKDFIDMANNTERIFKDPKIKELHLRYFDPTISAAKCHEDKGLIECLMVKCAKALIYTAGEKESYGKDAEAAMALSSGKPVIFFCPNQSKWNFYANVHPLTKLVDFSTGVANGAIVAKNIQEVTNLLDRIFKNKMEYEVKQENGYFKLIEKTTNSVIRIQTNHKLLTQSFWNYYHNK